MFNLLSSSKAGRGRLCLVGGSGRFGGSLLGRLESLRIFVRTK